MKLLDVTPDFKVVLNKDWLLTIPVFRKLIHRDKGSPGDNDGRKKLKAIKEFTYVYHIADPRSPLENYETFERQQKALQYAELKERDIDVDVLAAQTEYEELLNHSVPTLELLRTAKESKTQLTTYFRTIDFTERDNKGSMVHSPMQHIKNISLLKELHKSLIEFETLVYDELKENKGTRGKTELGDKEQKASGTKWEEGSIPAVDHKEDKAEGKSLAKLNANAPSFMRITDLNTKID